MKVIIDTDALLGIFNPLDIHHKTSLLITKNLADNRINTVILATTLGEFALLASSKIGLSQTKQSIEILKEFNISILEVNEKITHIAISIYQNQTSKEESLFDCFILAATQYYKINTIFSFDKGYKKKINQKYNIKLAFELFPNLN